MEGNEKEDVEWTVQIDLPLWVLTPTSCLSKCQHRVYACVLNYALVGLPFVQFHFFGQINEHSGDATQCITSV